MELPKELRTDDIQLSKLGFKKEGLRRYYYVPLEAKGWKVEYIESLKGYFICQLYNPSSFIPCEYVLNIIQFGELLGVEFSYTD